MTNEEEKKPPDQQKPALPMEKVRQHKCAESDSLQPTPERQAKTGGK
jgi:hypothetical protein